MRLRQAVGSVGNAEVAVMRVSAQPVGLEILFAVMADGDALLRPRLLGRLGLGGGHASLGPDGLARGSFGRSLVPRPFLFHRSLGCGF